MNLFNSQEWSTQESAQSRLRPRAGPRPEHAGTCPTPQAGWGGSPPSRALVRAAPKKGCAKPARRRAGLAHPLITVAALAAGDPDHPTASRRPGGLPWPPQNPPRTSWYGPAPPPGRGRTRGPSPPGGGCRACGAARNPGSPWPQPGGPWPRVVSAARAAGSPEPSRPLPGAAQRIRASWNRVEPAMRGRVPRPARGRLPCAGASGAWPLGVPAARSAAAAGSV